MAEKKINVIKTSLEVGTSVQVLQIITQVPMFFINS